MRCLGSQSIQNVLIVIQALPNFLPAKIETQVIRIGYARDPTNSRPRVGEREVGRVCR